MSTKRNDVVSASGIAAWEWCPEAWRLAEIGKEPGNQNELDCGRDEHEWNTLVEVWSRRVVALGWLLLVLSLAVAALGYLLFGVTE